MYAVPPAGNLDTAFTVTWASGKWSQFVVDIQWMYPGATSWVNWKRHQTTVTSQMFVPNHGAGIYSWRAHARLANSHIASDWSSAASINVSP